MPNKESEYRTPKDVLKELAKAYTKIGDLLFELQRMYKCKWGSLCVSVSINILILLRM